MKTLKFSQVIFIFLFLTGANLPAFSQGGGYPVYHNKLIVGDTVIIRYGVGFGQYDLSGLKAVLSPLRLYYPEFGGYFKDDTLWSFKAEFYADSTYDFYFAELSGTLPGEYKMFFLYEGNFIKGGEYVNVYTPPYIFQQPRDTIVCEGDSVKFEVMAMGNNDNDLLYKWYHNDVKYYEGYEGISIIGYPQWQDTGRYYCVISNQYGIDTTCVARLDLYMAPANPGPPAGPRSFCPGTVSTAYSINSDPIATGYEWQLFPVTAGIIEQQDDTSVRVNWNQTFSGFVELSVELMSSHCGATQSDAIEITIPGLSVPPEICIVGIDEETGKYRVVWEKTDIDSEQLYRIYRESNQVDVYLEVGAVYPDTFSLFVDPSSAPDILSHRYKLSYTDSCGNESELSSYHQTMHLAANIGLNNVVNLIWSEYRGIAFPAYDIYRGNHKDSMSLWKQVPSSVTSITDDDPPTGKIYYQIGMSNPAGCNPAKKAGPDYSSSRSNMEQVYISGVNEMAENKLFAVYPNPAGNEIQVRLMKSITSSNQFAIFNSLGALVLEGLIMSEYMSIDVSSLSQGFYILKLSDDKETWCKRFVINSKEF